MIYGETFVGRAADPHVFVAVVLGAQHVTAYVCDGAHREVDCWFYGQLIDGELDLVASNGGRLVGVRSSSGIDGWVVLRDGQRFRFLAQPATGAAGLYNVVALPDSRIRGQSTTWAVLDGKPMRPRSTWEFLPSLGSPAEWQILGLSSQQAFADGVTFTAQIAPLEGQTVPVVVWMPSVDAGRVWVILLAEGEARGRGMMLVSGAWIDAHSAPVH